MSASETGPFLYAMPVISRNQGKRILLVNKSQHEVELQVPGAKGGSLEYVDQTTGFDQPSKKRLDSDKIELGGFAVAALTLP
jgi:hypothetical protein